MGIERHVWSLGDADVLLFLEQPSLSDYRVGEIVGDPEVPVLPYCYMEGITLNITTALERRGTTNRGRRKIINRANAFDDITLSVDHLYFRKGAEFDQTNIFTPRRQLRLILKNEDWLYSDEFPFENDQFGLSFAYAQSFQLTGQKADVMEGTATFLAEQLI